MLCGQASLFLQLIVHLFAHDQQADEMHSCGQGPADGIADVQCAGRAEHPEDGCDPDQTEQAAAHQADDHGDHRVAASAQAAGQSVHYAAQEVGSADDLHPGQAGGHHGFIRGVEVQQDLTAKVSAAAQEQAHHSDAEQAVAHDAVEVVVPAGTHVLAGKGHGRLRKGIHAGVNEAL